MKTILLLMMALLVLLFFVERNSYSGEPSEHKNPFAGDGGAVKEGKEVYDLNCRICHGDDAKGNMGPDITSKKRKYGNSDAEMFKTISQGIPGNMPNWDNTLTSVKIWKVITFLRSIEE